MNVSSLIYFADLVNTGSMNATAERMFISQPALSNDIKRLEGELGCELLVRSKKGVQLTEMGKQMLPYVSGMLEQYFGMLDCIKTQLGRKEMKGTITIGIGIGIGIGMTVSKSFFDTFLNTLKEDCPGIQPVIFEGTRDNAIQSLEMGEADLIIMGGASGGDPEPALSENLRQELLYEDELVCVMSTRNPFAEKDRITEEDLRIMKTTVFGINYNSSEVFRRALLVSDNIQLHTRYMKEYDTMCVMAKTIYEGNFRLPNLTSRRFDEKLYLRNVLIYRKDAEPEKQALLEAVLETARKAAESFKKPE